MPPWDWLTGQAMTSLAVMVDHPILLERPIVVYRDRAVIARPPERLFELLSR